jgi:hypothetical protein
VYPLRYDRGTHRCCDVVRVRHGGRCAGQRTLVGVDVDVTDVCENRMELSHGRVAL